MCVENKVATHGNLPYTRLVRENLSWSHPPTAT